MISPSYTAKQKAQRNAAARRRWLAEQATLRKVRGKPRCKECTIVLERSYEVHARMCACCRYQRIFKKDYIRDGSQYRNAHPLAHLMKFED